MTEPEVEPQNPKAANEVAKFFKKAGLFCIGALLIFWGMNALFLRATDEAAKRRFEELFHPTSAPAVIILGDSHTANGVAPRFLERENFGVYNFSFAGADSVYYHHWYPLFVEHYPKPKLAIIQLNWFSFRETPYLFRTIEVDAEYLPWGTVLGLLSDPGVDHQKLFLSSFPLFQNRQKLDLALRPGFNFGEPLISLYDKGFVPVDEPVTPGGRLTFEPRPDRETRFRELVMKFRSTGVQVVLLQTPEFLAGREIDPSYQTQIAKVAEELEVPFLNFNTELVTEINHDPSNFTDWAHLSLKGAERFSLRLAEELTHRKLWEQP